LLFAGLGAGGILVLLRRRSWEDLRPLVLRAARRHHLDPGLVEAVVLAESQGNPRAVSGARAYGLMQLRLPTAAEVAGRPVTVEELFEPAVNLELGCRYLRRMFDRYQGNPRLALMAYNAGPARVDRWLAREPDAERVLRELAFPATRNYVRKVLGLLPRPVSEDRG